MPTDFSNSRRVHFRKGHPVGAGTMTERVMTAFQKLDEAHIRVDGQVRTILEETTDYILTSGEGHGIDAWLKLHAADAIPPEQQEPVP